MPYGITQCYLPPGRRDIPTLTPSKAGARFNDRGGMQGCVDVVVTGRHGPRRQSGRRHDRRIHPQPLWRRHRHQDHLPRIVTILNIFCIMHKYLVAARKPEVRVKNFGWVRLQVTVKTVFEFYLKTNCL